MSIGTRFVHLAVVGAAAIALSACGGSSSASAPGETIARLDTPNYATIPPVTTPPTSPPNGSSPEGEGADGDGEGASSAEASDYTIQSQDSIYGIAESLDVSVDELRELNDWPSDLNEVLLVAGNTIKVPADTNSGSNDSGTDSADDSGGDDADESSTEGSEDDGDDDSGDDGADDEADDGEGCTHTIEAGENPSKVASIYDISTDALIQANQSSGVLENFLVGDTLTIPAGADCP